MHPHTSHLLALLYPASPLLPLLGLLVNTSTAARHAYDDVLHSKGLLKNERVEQKVARAEETVQDWGKIVNVNGGTVLCAAGDGVIDVVDGVVFVDGDGNDENSEKKFWPVPRGRLYGDC